MPREDSVISLLNSYLELNFEVIEKAEIIRYDEGNEIKLDSLALIGLFSIFKLTTSSGKHIEDISHAHIVPLLCILVTSSRGVDDLSIRFHRDRFVRRDDLARNKNLKRIYHLRPMLMDVFGFAEHQEKTTHDLG